MLQRNKDAGIPAFAILVMQHGMAVKKCAAPGILPGQPHRHAVAEQAGIGQVFSHAPIQGLSALPHQFPIIHDLLHARVQA
jgi:hypothetical protein